MLGLQYQCFIDIERLLEHQLHEIGVLYDIAPDDEMDGEEALTAPDLDQVQISESVYAKLLAGDYRARFTIIHEIGHLLKHRNITPSFARSSGHGFFEDSEWQADCFAAEFLMPPELAARCRNVADIQATFGVSFQAATIRVRNLRKEGVIKW